MAEKKIDASQTATNQHNASTTAAKTAAQTRTGGLSSLDATSVFRITNFELFVKPNKYVMTCGLFAITFCSVYIYMWRKDAIKEPGTYIAVQEDGTEVVKKSVSRWD